MYEGMGVDFFGFEFLLFFLGCVSIGCWCLFDDLCGWRYNILDMDSDDSW